MGEFTGLVIETKRTYHLSNRQMADGLNCYLIDPREHYSLEAPRLWTVNGRPPYHSRLEAIYNRAPEGSWQREFTAKAMSIITKGGQ